MIGTQDGESLDLRTFTLLRSLRPFKNELTGTEPLNRRRARPEPFINCRLRVVQKRHWKAGDSSRRDVKRSVLFTKGTNDE